MEFKQNVLFSLVFGFAWTIGFWILLTIVAIFGAPVELYSYYFFLKVGGVFTVLMIGVFVAIEILFSLGRLTSKIFKK